MNRKNLADNLRLLCVYNKIPATDLSIELSLSPTRIGDIIASRNIKLTTEEIERIANYFKITVEQLLNKKAILEFK